MKSTQTKVVYTAVFGNYDNVPVVNPEWDCDFICFTDNPDLVSTGWQVVKVQLNGEHPAQANRRYKMLPHKYLCNYDRSLYVDGNIRIVADPSPLFQKYLDNGIIAIPKHPIRNCAYEEALACIARDLVNKVTVEQQMARYAAQGFPKKYGLTANGIILRNHFDKNIIVLMMAWWGEYCSGGGRDQLSLAYLIWKKNIDIAIMAENAWNENKYFRIGLHCAQKHTTLIGRLVDYICCNGQRSNFHKVVYKAFQMLGKIRFLRRNLH